MKKLNDIRFEQVYCTNCRYWSKLLNSIENDLDCPKPCNVCYPYSPEDSTTMLKRPQYIKGYEKLKWKDDDDNIHEYNCELVGIDLANGKDKTSYITFYNGSVNGMIPYEKCESIRGKRSEIYEAYDKYLKRVKNRKKLHEKLKKLGR